MLGLGENVAILEDLGNFNKSFARQTTVFVPVPPCETAPSFNGPKDLP